MNLAEAKRRVRAAEEAMGFGVAVIVMVSSTDRVRAFRKREEEGLIRLGIEFDHFDLVDGLIRKGDITEAGSRDRKRLASAVAIALRKYFSQNL